jgi:glycosyltransferase involved in cell wall biosynthesis
MDKANKAASTSHLVLIPSYNTGAKLRETVMAAISQWRPVWVVIDGSTDGSDQSLQVLAATTDHLQVITLPKNGGKGAAVLEGLRRAQAAGFTHVLTMDADGQHPAESIETFMQASVRQPQRMILGKPQFAADAPRARVYGRQVSNSFAHIETLWAGVGDSLFGFRVYPIAPLRQIMERCHWMRRFDFDPEAVVRLCWAGVRPFNISIPVRYFSAEEGGVSHFHYGRDNLLLTWMHTRLMLGCALRLPQLIWRRFLNPG